MRIIHVIPRLNKGGAERLVIDICNSLHENHDVTLITFDEVNAYSETPFNFQWKIIPAEYIPSLSGKSKNNTDALRTAVLACQPDVIHTHLFEADLVTRKALEPEFKSLSTAFFSHLHDNIPQLNNSSPPYQQLKLRLIHMHERRIMKRLFKKSNNQFIAISEDTQSYLTKVLPSYKEKVTLLKNAIQFTRFEGEIRTSINHSPIRLVTIGSLVDKKNQAFLVDIVQAINQLGHLVDLRILGDGPNRAKIERLIEKQQLSSQISLLGNVAHVEQHLHWADIYLHPATYEPFGLVLLEANAAGLPAIAMDGKGNRDISLDNQNGYLIKAALAPLFAQKVDELVKQPTTYIRLSSFAIEFAKQYDINSYVERLLELYKLHVGQS